MSLASCTTYQFTARQTEINRRQMDTKNQRAALQIDYNHKVTATSNYQITRKDAIAEAEFMCIEAEQIDVVVDPIYKIEFNPFKFKKNFRATIIGFAGKYEEKENLLDESKKYTIEDIEKYKLLYDPSFLPYYYQQPIPSGGDVYNYYIKSDVGPAAPTKSPIVNRTSPSLMLQNQPIAPRPFKQYTREDLRKAKQLRDGGISISVIGAVLCLPVGLPMVFSARTYEAEIAGLVFIGVGAATAAAGIPMASVGGVRYNRAKKAQSMDITLNSNQNGLGVALHF
ncbi:MAG: hypothetical protein IJ814_00790 [Paludibacteraceae bacterium]|nr:hypothetical protein [Paludibacteraceae bacterium]